MRLFVAAAGDVNNERLKNCYVCARNGWPHESISFDKIPGRVLSDGNNEGKGYVIRDYFTGNKHVHKQRRA